MAKVQLYNLLVLFLVIGFWMRPMDVIAQAMNSRNMETRSASVGGNSMIKIRQSVESKRRIPYRLRHLMTLQERRLSSPIFGPSLPPTLSSAGIVQSWLRNYPPTFDSTFWATGIAVDKQGNVYVTGFGGDTTNAHADFVTVKYTAAGDIVWARRYNGPSNGDDRAFAIALDTSSNVYVTGKSDSAGIVATSDYATIKYNSSGTQQWVSRYNGPVNGEDAPSDICVDASGNVYVTGYSVGSNFRDYATIKYNPSTGVSVWVMRYDSGSGHDVASAIVTDAVGNVYVTGSGATSGGSEYVTIKYSSGGTQRWVSHSASSADALANDVAVDASGNVYVTGYAAPTFSNYDFATVKYDSAGTQIWDTRFDGQGSNNDDEGIALAVDGSGNVFVTGASGSPTGNDFDFATVKYNSSGVQQGAAARYAGVATDADEPSDLKLDAGGNVYVTGTSGGDFATIKYSSSLVQQWLQRYDGGGIYDQTSTMALDTLGHVYVTGKSGSGNVSRFTTIKYAQNLINASVKVFLEGPYSAGSMSNTLKTSGTLASHFTGLTIPANAVDSIAVEIRSSTSGSGSATRAFAPAWLLRDGTIKSFSDTTLSYVGLDAPAGSYYMVVWHRNHLAVMSASAQSLSSSVPGSPYDFTTGQSQGFGTNPMDQLATGVFGMISGDANQSGIVSASDANLVFGSLNATGYNVTDINLSNFVTASDANIVFGNLNKTSQVPP